MAHGNRRFVVEPVGFLVPPGGGCKGAATGVDRGRPSSPPPQA
eukprot:CAMPEP_0194294380 /NCGR_PEP_ID=MMETSP0169-20130528/50503_1 /TAXON_ID=218684 /ORGANISM="Corethron pennatum, Strain L29A3" /LENGTH=42 /DNA_ID= /DNA_START= /DNA_END= /DNA_ORIENTATION=